jgi:hypothetical protein
LHDLAAVKRLRQRIEEVSGLIGPPLRRPLQQSSPNPILNRTSWECGCVVGYLDRPFDGREPALRWDACGEHRLVAGPETA